MFGLFLGMLSVCMDCTLLWICGIPCVIVWMRKCDYCRWAQGRELIISPRRVRLA